MNETDFRALVKRMRDEQRLYFRTRDRDALQLAQRLERQVDRELANVGPSLFDRKETVTS